MILYSTSLILLSIIDTLLTTEDDLLEGAGERGEAGDDKTDEDAGGGRGGKGGRGEGGEGHITGLGKHSREEEEDFFGCEGRVSGDASGEGVGHEGSCEAMRSRCPGKRGGGVDGEASEVKKARTGGETAGGSGMGGGRGIASVGFEVEGGGGKPMVIGCIDERGALARSNCGACVGWHLLAVQGQTVEAFHSSAEVSKWMRGPNGRRVQLQFWGNKVL